MDTLCVYILKCADDSYYTGVTNDIQRRLFEHNTVEDRKSYLFSRRPFQLVFCEYFPTPAQAIDFEKKVKGWTRKKKEALIKRDWEKLNELAK